MATLPPLFTIVLGKALRSAMQLRGGGSALPGLFVEHVSPSFVKDTLTQLPMGVVIISGTNGKTTTTKMVVALLESQSLRVFTNRTGSNFVRGVAAALLGSVDRHGKLHADIAVLELDEAHAVKFVEHITPRYSLLLNVMRDQLDRFGEIDTTATMLRSLAQATTTAVVLNREDHRIAAVADDLPKTVARHYFGLDTSLLGQFPSDDELHQTSRVQEQPLASLPQEPRPKKPAADVVLASFDDHGATFVIGRKRYTTPLTLKGVYNIYNSAAALALVRVITPQAPIDTLFHSLAKLTPAFGRGETVTVDGQPLELVLVKNPAGFRLGLSSYTAQGYATMIAINDNYADGRDMSWLWDVDFSSLNDANSPIWVTGVRAYDMALRLQYEEVPVGTIEPRLQKALQAFIAEHPNQPKRIYCTYTAMLSLRKELSKITKVEVIL